VLIGWDGGANSVAVQSDGRILVAGTADDGDGHPVFALARYHADGSPDAAFGAGGQVRAEFGGSAGADALALQPDGRIVVAGSATNGCGAGGCSSVFALARCNADGSLDTSFGIDGRVLTGIANADAAASALALQPDGQIVLAGSANGSTEFALARYQGH
jgi:uncharacterized delta-60 repeat protein